MAITDLIARGIQSDPVGSYMKGFNFQENVATNRMNRDIAAQQADMRRQQFQAQKQQTDIARGNEYFLSIAPLIESISDLPEEEKQSAYTNALPQIKKEAARFGMPVEDIDDEWDEDEAKIVTSQLRQLNKNRGTYYTRFEGKDGNVYIMDSRTGEVKDTGIVAAKYDVPLIADIEFKKKMSGELGKLQAQAKDQLPSTEASADRTVKYIEELVNHPGMKDVIGLPDKPWALKGYMWGTDAADFKSRFDQLTGRSFMEVFPTLKGGGPITDREGEKATDAINRMKSATSETAFLTAAKDLVDEINILREKVRKRAGEKPKDEPQEEMKVVTERRKVGDRTILLYSDGTYGEE